MSDLERFSQLVSVLYEAAADPLHWPRFLREVNVTLHAGHACLTAISSDPAATKVLLSGYTPDEERAYAEYYREVDLVLQRALERHAAEGDWHGGFETILPPDEMERTELYNDYMRPIGLYQGGAVVNQGKTTYSLLGLGVWRSRRDKPLTPDELRMLRMIGPHLEQGFALNDRLSTLHAHNECLHAGLEAASVALIGLNARGAVLTVTDSAQRMLTAHDGLEIANHSLRARDGASDKKLQPLIAHALTLATRTEASQLAREVPATWAVHVRRQGKRPLRVVVFPFRSGSLLGGVRPAVLLFLSDPDAALPSRTDVLQQLFSLSAMQGKLADLLVSGVDLKDAASRLGITYDSARFQLKEIFRRTGTHKQSELTRLLLELPSRSAVMAATSGRHIKLG